MMSTFCGKVRVGDSLYRMGTEEFPGVRLYGWLQCSCGESWIWLLIAFRTIGVQAYYDCGRS